MRRSALALVLLLGLPAPQASRADWVARQVEDRDTGRDARSTLRMRLVDRHGRSRERALTLLTLRGTAPRGGRPATASGGDRLLLRFTYPNDIKGTGFLVWEHPDADDERFLYLPSLGRVRRIAGTETQESFAGSDFTYEDIGGREFEDFSYALLDENASWVAPDGARRPAWRLESTRKDAAARHPRVVSLVTKESFVVVEAEIFNRRNEREKRYSVRRLQQIEGIWTALEMTMVNEGDRTRTELVIEAIDYNVGLSERDFTRRELERPGARPPVP
jgi:hypothetical protein